MFDRPITVLVGALGAGKTAVAASGAAAIAHERKSVALVDLDLAHPGFRSVHMIRAMADRGVAVLRLQGDDPFAATPVLLSTVRHLLALPAQRAIFDLGSDARSAGAFAELAIPAQQIELLLVVNFNRPFTFDVPGALQVAHEAESALGMRLNGLFCNTHLMGATSEETLKHGVDLATETANKLNIPVCGVAVDPEVHARIKNGALRNLSVLRLEPDLRIEAEPPVRVRRSSVGPTFV